MEESLADAGRIVDYLSYRGVVVKPVPVVEYGIHTHAEVIRTAVGQKRRDGGGLSRLFRDAVAVKYVHSALWGHHSLLSHILYPYAEFQAALVDIELTRIENRLLATVVKCSEAHEIVKECVKMAINQQKIMHVVYRIRLFLQGQVLFYQRQDFRLLVLGT